MLVQTYHSKGGKDLILEFIDQLPKDERAEAYLILSKLQEHGIEYLRDMLNTRKIENKLWEIKFYRANRIFYVLTDNQTIYLLHACIKQKNKAELKNLEVARLRAKEVL